MSVRDATGPAASVAVVALGSNLGDRADTLGAALSALAALPLTSDVRAAEPIETIAVKLEGEDQDAPRYLNSVALVQTRLGPSVLLGHLHRIEADLGRVRRERWGDRTLDLDLIAYGGVRSGDPRLTLPHPRAHERAFVLAPWLALDPSAELPGVGRATDLLESLTAGESAPATAVLS